MGSISDPHSTPIGLFLNLPAPGNPLTLGMSYRIIINKSGCIDISLQTSFTCNFIGAEERSGI